MATEASSNNMLEKVKEAISNQESIKEDQEKKNYSNCANYFGYLAKLSKEAPVPEECFLCPKVVECIAPL